MSQTVEIKVFLYHFCLMIEGSGSTSGSGSVPMANGSGSCRLKNLRIRIHNTAFNDFSWFDKLFLGYRVKRLFGCKLYKEYYWRGLYEIPTYRGKIKRIIAQFSPHGWIEFQWNPLSSVERWIAIICIIGVFLVTGVSIIFAKNSVPNTYFLYLFSDRIF